MERHKINYKLAIWILLLRFIAGYLNVMVLLLFAQSVAGHTGNLTKVAILFAHGDYDVMLNMASMSISFLVGATVGGYFYPTDRFQPRLNYGNYLIIMGVILLLFNWFGYQSVYFLIYIAFSFGLQNGMFVFYKGLVIRTTILTGTVTDIGVELGRNLRGGTEDRWKLRFHIVNLLCFLIGAVSATAIHLYTNWNVLLIAAVIDIAIGLYYFTLKEEMIKDSLEEE